MQLQVGDRFSDERGDWEVKGRPATLVGGKTVRALVGRPYVGAGPEERVWGAHEKVVVRRR